MIRQLGIRACLAFTFIFVLNACGSSDKKQPEQPPAPPAADGATATTGASAEPTPADLLAQKPKVNPLPWSYEGETGPAFWSLIDPLFAMCGQGKKQSPVDLVFRKPVKGKSVEFHYKPEALTLIDNGHTVQINFTPGQTAKLHGQNYELQSMQFRTSSEHTLSGNELPMEIQLIHQNKKGKTAIVSVIVIEGQSNPFLEKVWSKIPGQKMQANTHADVIINAQELIPAALTHYKYSGSLTNPPCTEDVDWYVLNTPVTASGDQILAFRKVYSSNKRPIQPLNGRKVTNH